MVVGGLLVGEVLRLDVVCFLHPGAGQEVVDRSTADEAEFHCDLPFTSPFSTRQLGVLAPLAIEFESESEEQRFVDDTSNGAAAVLVCRIRDGRDFFAFFGFLLVPVS